MFVGEFRAYREICMLYFFPFFEKGSNIISYGYTEYKINSFYDGDYAYWMASGIKTDASEDVISDCVELFCSENLAE